MAKTIIIGGQEASLKDVKTAILAQLEENSNSEVFSEMVKAVIKVAGPKRSSATSKTSVLRDLFIEKNILTEDEIWSQFKWGKHETLSTCWNFRKKGNPEDYLYISFVRINEENQSEYSDYEIGTGIYVLKGQGVEAPEGYVTGKKAKKAEDSEEV